MAILVGKGVALELALGVGVALEVGLGVGLALEVGVGVGPGHAPKAKPLMSNGSLRSVCLWELVFVVLGKNVVLPVPRASLTIHRVAPVPE